MVMVALHARVLKQHVQSSPDSKKGIAVGSNKEDMHSCLLLVGRSGCFKYIKICNGAGAF